MIFFFDILSLVLLLFHLRTQPYILSIPKSCTQPWDKMQETGEGRYCQSCQKIVIDFSSKTDNEIIEYFTAHFNSPTCGRFKKQQLANIRLHIPTYVFEKRLPGWKRFLLIFLVCFGSFAFNMEVVLAQNEGTNTETRETRKVKKSVKRKKKKLALRNRPFILYDKILPHPENMIFGYTVTYPKDELDIGNLFPTEPVNFNTLLSENPSTGTLPRKNNPMVPFPKPECYLPAVTRIRRTVRKKKI